MGNLIRMTRRISSQHHARVRRLATLLCSAGIAAAPLEAQRSGDLGGAVLAAGELTGYLRTRELLDSTRNVRWGLQPFSPAQERALDSLSSGSAHPWQARLAETRRARGLRGLQWTPLRPDVQFINNSQLPVGQNDGVLWAGRGLTMAAQWGVVARWGPLRAQFAPIAFRAQNADYVLYATGRTGLGVYRDPRRPTQIDRPQRFGDEPYGRVDLGDSFIELEWRGVHAGLSNARLQWGPAREYPLVQSVNGGGFPHAFIGTARPVSIGIGELHLRHIVGRLEQTPWSPVDTGPTHRLHVGFTASFTPSLIRGFEIGGARVMNVGWREGMPTFRQLTRPFQGVINDLVSDINANAENQFASVFVRIAPPSTGFEAFVEWARDDFSGNLRWLLLQPDDLGAATLGVAQSVRSADGALHSVRAEYVNGDLSHGDRTGRTLFRPFPMYIHGRTRQGLTNRGQLLGSPAAYGGAGATLTWERFDTRGRRTYSIDRTVIADWYATLGPVGGLSNPEVRYGLRAEWLRFRGASEWVLGVAPSWTLNRRLDVGSDVFNLNVTARWRGW